jgi:ABC-type uncharacterized transport system ATPase subunit
VLHQAEQICDRIFLINHGVKLLDATLDEIHEQFDPRTILAEPVDRDVKLDHVAGVGAIRPTDAGAVEMEIENGADVQAIMRDVLASGAMRSVALRRLSLSEVFIRLVKQDQGVEAAERVREELVHDA